MENEQIKTEAKKAVKSKALQSAIDVFDHMEQLFKDKFPGKEIAFIVKNKVIHILVDGKLTTSVKHGAMGRV